MARKPNYDFERKERERLKAAKTAERNKAKAAAKAAALNGDPLSADGDAGPDDAGKAAEPAGS